ncbi:MAG TPA: YdcF family protein [Candidatus Limnocylindrales bacterium]|nr:YdcF family protein [Candidatus Limnocylindrales bacterium]
MRVRAEVQEVPRPIAGRLARDVAILLTAGAIGIAGATALGVVQIVRQGEQDEARPADAIVVLGAAQYNGVPSGVFRARLDHAVALYAQGIAKWFVVTGGKQPGDRTTEAATARVYAEAHGVPAAAILGEDEGRDTLESLQSVGAIMRARGLRSAVFVSDRSHMLRVLRMATDQGLEAWGSPTATSPSDLDTRARWQSIAHELAGLAAYFVGGNRLVADPAVSGS